MINVRVCVRARACVCVCLQTWKTFLSWLVDGDLRRKFKIHTQLNSRRRLFIWPQGCRSCQYRLLNQHCSSLCIMYTFLKLIGILKLMLGVYGVCVWIRATDCHVCVLTGLRKALTKMGCSSSSKLKHAISFPASVWQHRSKAELLFLANNWH